MGNKRLLKRIDVAVMVADNIVQGIAVRSPRGNEILCSFGMISLQFGLPDEQPAVFVFNSNETNVKPAVDTIVRSSLDDSFFRDSLVKAMAGHEPTKRVMMSYLYDDVALAQGHPFNFDSGDFPRS